MKKLPVGIQTFKKILEGDYVYVDKTQYIYNLIEAGSCYFLSRPRRFGKSLLLDTISEVFKGNKELFNGLWIYDSDYAFEKYPVIRLDMSGIANKNPTALENSLFDELNHLAGKENVEISGGGPSDLFKRLIEQLHLKYNQKVVILIDEYDQPILDHITNIEIADANREVMRKFYGILKSMDPYLKFTFITGVTKFAKTSIFSGLNNLLDITMSKKYPNICGITIEDLGEYFSSHMEYISKLEDFSQYDNIQDKILYWYDGYSWDGKTRVINPFSLLSFFMQERFSGFWYATGTPRFLLDLIKEKPESYTNIRNFEITEKALDSIEIDKIAIEPLLFQTGYLTVKEIPKTMGSPVYRLEIPNFEVREAFSLHVLSALTDNDEMAAWHMREDIMQALGSGNLNKVLDVLRAFFASIPYNLHVGLEAYYHSLFYTIMSLLGFDMDLEVPGSMGRIDAVIEVDDKVYVMEFKYKKCPPDADDDVKQKLFDKALDEAMGQINDREYAAKYQGSGKTVYKAAFAFLGRGDISLRVQ